MHRPDVARPLGVAVVVALMALSVWGAYEVRLSVISYRSSKLVLERASSDLARMRQAALALEPRAPIPTSTDALVAATLLQSDWQDRMLELERCVIEPARLVRLQLHADEQETAAFLAV
ncbi:MAG: hypothetical protein K2X42_01025, partial [Burkholderiaceae bacterium]|nr:hypothetical protein [Burkholderiaceae bacterium]